MTEIPQDIWDAADQAHYKGHRHQDNRVKIDFIAAAILAERERCAEIARNASGSEETYREIMNEEPNGK